MDNQQNQKPKRRYWKFALGFLGIIVIVAGGFFVWERYFSPMAKINRETQKNYEKYLAWEENYKKAMTEDTYGGKTPEETLQMFIEALEKEDVELASRYFMLDENMDRKKWIDRLNSIRQNDYLLVMIKDIEEKAKPDIQNRLNENDYKFVLRADDGTVGAVIDMEFNKHSGIWKIESL
ncbi:MAG: hypothetical protein Q8N28_01980 [bacterium]|nr:hypothetical protein [bacterium]